MLLGSWSCMTRNLSWDPAIHYKSSRSFALTLEKVMVAEFVPQVHRRDSASADMDDRSYCSAENWGTKDKLSPPAALAVPHQHLSTLSLSAAWMKFPYSVKLLPIKHGFSRTASVYINFRLIDSKQYIQMFLEQADNSSKGFIAAPLCHLTHSSAKPHLRFDLTFLVLWTLINLYLVIALKLEYI